MPRQLPTRRRLLAEAFCAIGLLLVACKMSTTPNSSAADATTAERVRIGAISWYVDYDAAVEIAREQDKALWVHFGENPG